jgi:hypothetical protein
LALLFGLSTTLVWLMALRLTPHFFWISPIFPWTACAATVALTIWFKRRLDLSSLTVSQTQTAERA